MPSENTREAELKRHMKVVWIWIAILGVIIIALSVVNWIQNIPPPPGKYDALAQCIASSGATFYGAFWCPHCAAQKAAFGDAVKYLPYVECSTPDALGQTQVCINHGIKNYPTWVFHDSSTLVGVQSLATLAQKTGCAMPQ